MIPTDAGLIPTGEIRPITKGDVFDFSEAKPIGQDIDKDDERLVMTIQYYYQNMMVYILLHKLNLKKLVLLWT